MSKWGRDINPILDTALYIFDHFRNIFLVFARAFMGLYNVYPMDL